MKTKPTQYAARSLNSVGIQPDFILCRSEQPVDEVRKNKIALFCSVPKNHVIASPDVDFIYEIPVNYDDERLGEKILSALKLKVKTKDLKDWRKEVERIRGIDKKIKIGIVGKYFNSGNFMLADSYISVIESVKQAAWSNGYKPEIEWISSEDFEEDPKSIKRLKQLDGVIIPGGFGSRGIEGKISTVKFLRENNIPLLGICYGMQIICIEFARNVCGLKGANTTEIDQETKYPVIDIMPEQKKNLKEKNYGATMRLGAYPAQLKTGTIAYSTYKTEAISERHRHRWEVSPEYIETLESKGLVFSGKSPNGKLMEIAELKQKDHPFLLGTQFHPEFKTRFMKPHPIFNAFMKAAVKGKEGKK
jgi:CTP synthase